jgi:hypothetical protein
MFPWKRCDFICFLVQGVAEYYCRQHLSDELEMKIYDDDGMQPPRHVPNFGIEVNFERLYDDDREVSCSTV